MRNNLPLPAPVNQIYRLKVLGKIEGQVTVTTFYYSDKSAVGGPVGAAMQDLFDAFTSPASVFSAFCGCVSIDWVSDRAIIDVPTAPTVAQQEFPFTTSATVPGAHMPTQIAATVIKRTAFKGQCGRGRWALPAVPDSFVSLSSITNLVPYTAFMEKALETLQGAGLNFRPILFSRNGSQAHPGAVGAADLSALTLNHTVGTSRRRKLGVGI